MEVNTETVNKDRISNPIAPVAQTWSVFSDEMGRATSHLAQKLPGPDVNSKGFYI